MSEVVQVPVLIVGGGAAGLTMSVLLSGYGVESLVVERRADTSGLPKAHILNQRTMEILGEAGVADEVYAQGAPHEWMSRTIWMTSLAGPRPEDGQIVGWTDTWGGGEQLAAHLAASPCRTTNLPQLRLEPILKRRAETLAPDGVRFEHELVALEQDGDGVRATVRDLAGGETYEVRAQYAVGADGGRTVPEALGIGYEGQRGLLKMVTSYIRADLTTLPVDPRCCMYWFISPDTGGSIGSGVLVKMGGRDWGPGADEFAFSFATDAADDHDFTPEEATARFHRSIGTDAVPVEVRRMSTWTLESIVADRFGEGRVFLVGDAAHRHPPTGGLGLNTAIGDVHNLAWKLHAVLDRSAGAGLLASYEAERRPVAISNATQSLKSWFQHGEVDAAMGLSGDTPPEEGWASVRTLFSATPEGERMRALVDGAVRRKRDEFCAQNLEIGYDYRSAAIVDDGITPPVPDDPVCGFIAGTWPGHRVPHARIVRDGRSQSTYDLARLGRFVLFVGPDAAPWAAAAATAAQRLAIDLDVVSIGDDGDYADPTGAWERQREVTDAGAVLVRPDQHVAWRSIGAVGEPAQVLQAALEEILSRPASPAAVSTASLASPEAR
jgi:2,4-dichlorophenol 6-monooxygenase